MHNSFRKKLMNASFAGGLGFIISSLIVLIWSYILVKLYPASESGQLLLCLSVAGLINMLDLGTSVGITRVLSHSQLGLYPYSPRCYFISVALVALLTEAMAAILLMFWWEELSLPKLPFYGNLSLILLALSSQATLICVGFFKGLLNFRVANLIAAGSTIVVYGLGALMLSRSSNIWTIFATMSFSQLICALIASVYIFKLTSSENFSERFDLKKTILIIYPNIFKASIVMFPQMFAGIFFLHIQRFVIALYAGIDSVAILSLAYSIATRIHGVINASLEFLFPMAQHLRSRGHDMVSLCLRLGGIFSFIYLAAAFLLVIIAFFFAPYIVDPLIAYLIGVLFAIFAVPAFHYLNGTGHALKLSMASLSGPIIYLVLSVTVKLIGLNYSYNIMLPYIYSITMAVLSIWIFFLLFKRFKPPILKK